MSGVLHVIGAISTLVISGLVALYGSVSDSLPVAVSAALIFLAPVWSADLVRKHREQAETERLRAEQTALLAELDRRTAVVAERARMARELHDVVANHLSAIAIHATGAQSLARRRHGSAEPAATAVGAADPLLDSLAVIRENSVQGLAELRRMVVLLRTPASVEESYQAPNLDALDTLLERAREAGRGAGLAFEAEQWGERGRLPAPVELAAYRIVQESLTNALKHAARGTVRLSLSHGPERVEIAVESPYRAGDGRELPGARAGLVGMGERAQLLGGSFEAGPSGDVWRVRAVLPREPVAGQEERKT
jgi:signal transduction histidine kinase